ncbi:MAG: exodeoxyribonuclease III [Bacteroidales bacterium]|nr:exodeoxyribonuclease III [Bacteroidales bacterium]
MKIASYNVNGIRAAMKKGFMEWLKNTDADVVCIQETKAQVDQIPQFEFAEAGYETYAFSAKKKGYSGVAILCKTTPDKVVSGMGIPAYDDEGRFIRADFGPISVVSVYHPSGSSGELRQEFKMQWLSDFQNYVTELRNERPKLIISGDYNICHEAIDIHAPKRNKNSSGFLPEEREWMTSFLKTGFIDSFRHLNKDPDNYTWWSYRANARANNKGWRIDYHMVSDNLEAKIKNVEIHTQAFQSDHCPLIVELD